MPGKLVIPCTEKQYEKIIKALYNGIPNVSKPNEQVAVALQTEGNTGLRIGDTLRLKLSDIILVNGKYRFNMVEHKTGKKRQFYVQKPVYEMLKNYCKQNNIQPPEQIFSISVRDVQKVLKRVCDFYKMPHISTHSFRKRFATRAYEASGYDIELVRKLMQHSSATITIRYLGIQDAKIEKVLKRIVNVIDKEKTEE